MKVHMVAAASWLLPAQQLPLAGAAVASVAAFLVEPVDSNVAALIRCT